MKLKRILIIDNDKDVLYVLKQALVYENFDVIALPDVTNIFELIKEHRPNLIILDYSLQGTNGGKICSHIKSSPDTANMPVIVLSSFPRFMHPLGSYNCDALVEKPFDLAQLTRTINMFI